MLNQNSWLGLVALSSVAVAIACSGNNGDFGDNGDGGATGNEGGTTDDEGGAPMDDSGIPLPKDPALASGVTITQIAGYQTVKVPMMNNGSPANGKAPLVAGKEANIRVFFKLDAGWSPHNIVAVMTITAGGNTTTVKDILGPVMDSTEDTQVSTFNLHLDGSQVTDGSNPTTSNMLRNTSRKEKPIPEPTLKMPTVGLTVARYTAFATSPTYIKSRITVPSPHTSISWRLMVRYRKTVNAPRARMGF